MTYFKRLKVVLSFDVEMRRSPLSSVWFQVVAKGEQLRFALSEDGGCARFLVAELA